MPSNASMYAFKFTAATDLINLSTLLLFGYIGFTLWQLGLCQPKNTSSIIINNLCTTAFAVVCYWATGYAFALGHASNPFLSYARFFLIDASAVELPIWYWHCILATLFILIANGGFVERMKSSVYCIFAILFSCIFYPIGSHWCWHQDGWLYNGVKNAAGTGRIHLMDKGGAGPIHLSAGTVAFIAGLFLKPRKDRKSSVFDSLKFVGGQTNANVFLGGFTAMFCLIIRNITMSNGNMSLAAMNSILAAAASAATAFMFKRSALFGENWNVKTLISGCLTGLVSVSTGPEAYLPYGAFAIGFVAGIAFIGWSVALKHHKFDDVVDTVATHLGGGIWALLAASLFNKSSGVFYSGRVDSYKHFGWSLLAVLVYFVWNCIGTCMVFLPFYFKHGLRYRKSLQVDTRGIDAAVLFEPAYPKKHTFPVMNNDNNNSKRIKSVQASNRDNRKQRETNMDEYFKSRTTETFFNHGYQLDIENPEQNAQVGAGERIESWSPSGM